MTDDTIQGTDESALAKRIKEFHDHAPPPAPSARTRLDSALEQAARARTRRLRSWRVGALVGLAATLLIAAGTIGYRRRTPVDAAEVPFAVNAPAARSVALVGSFNQWNARATPMRRNPATGRWSTALRLQPGRYVYAYVLDGTTWVVDPLAPRMTEQDYGLANTLLLAANRR